MWSYLDGIGPVSNNGPKAAQMQDSVITGIVGIEGDICIQQTWSYLDGIGPVSNNGPKAAQMQDSVITGIVGIEGGICKRFSHKTVDVGSPVRYAFQCHWDMN